MLTEGRNGQIQDHPTDTFPKDYKAKSNLITAPYNSYFHFTLSEKSFSRSFYSLRCFFYTDLLQFSEVLINESFLQTECNKI